MIQRYETVSLRNTIPDYTCLAVECADDDFQGTCKRIFKLIDLK